MCSDVQCRKGHRLIESSLRSVLLSRLRLLYSVSTFNMSSSPNSACIASPTIIVSEEVILFFHIWIGDGQKYDVHIRRELHLVSAERMGIEGKNWIIPVELYVKGPKESAKATSDEPSHAETKIFDFYTAGSTYVSFAYHDWSEPRISISGLWTDADVPTGSRTLPEEKRTKEVKIMEEMMRNNLKELTKDMKELTLDQKKLAKDLEEQNQLELEKMADTIVARLKAELERGMLDMFHGFGRLEVGAAVPYAPPLGTENC